MNKKALIFLILTIISFFASLFLNASKIRVSHFGGLHKEVCTDVIFKNEQPKIFYEDKEIKNYIKIDKNHYLFTPNELNLVKKITIKNTENIEKLMIFNANEAIFVDDIKEEIKINNDKSLLDKASISFLSFFYNPQFYLVSYIFLFIFLCNFQFNYKRTRIVLISLLLLSFFLRIAQLNNVPFWDDEIYVITHTNKWLEAFQDPGNPPFYFILFKIYRTIVQNPDFYKFSSVILGLLFNLSFFIYLKFIFGKKTALIGLFLASINLILIYYSQEIRSYILLMLLSVISSYLLFKFNSKTKFAYLTSIVALLNTHFYGAFYVLYNFIFGLSVFKNKIKIKNFILINLAAFFAFLPVLIYKKASITSSFNTWLKEPVLNTYISVIDTLFGNIYAFIAFLLTILLLYFRISKKDRLFVKYNYFAIFFVFLCALLFTYAIKPIFFAKYFHVVFPNVLAIIAYIFAKLSKKRFGIIAIFLLFYLFAFKCGYQNLFCNHSLYIDFIRHDIDKNKTNYIFMSDTVTGYKKFEIEGAELKYLPVNYGIDVLNIKKFNLKKPSTVYALNFYLDSDFLIAAKKIELYKTPIGVFCKIEL